MNIVVGRMLKWRKRNLYGNCSGFWIFSKDNSGLKSFDNVISKRKLLLIYMF